MGPNCSIAVVGPQSATVLCMAQGPYTTRQAIAAALGLPATLWGKETRSGLAELGQCAGAATVEDPDFASGGARGVADAGRRARGWRRLGCSCGEARTEWHG